MGYDSVNSVCMRFSAEHDKNRMVCTFRKNINGVLRNVFVCGIDDDGAYRFIDADGKQTTWREIYRSGIFETNTENCADTEKEALARLIYYVFQSAKDAAIEFQYKMVGSLTKGIEDFLSGYSKLKIGYADLLSDIDMLVTENTRLRNEIKNGFRNMDRSVRNESQDLRDCKKRLRKKTTERKARIYSYARNSKRKHVYLMRHTNGLIKIGHAANPRAREKTLQAEDPRLHLIGSFYADAKTEKRLHDIFAELRVRGEWFRLEDRHVDWILTLKPQKAKARKRRFGGKLTTT